MNSIGFSVTKKFKEALQKSPHDCVVILGPDHLKYLTGASLPFLDQVFNQMEWMVVLVWDKKRGPVVLCPSAWESTLRGLSWLKRIVVYSPPEPKEIPTVFQLLLKILEGPNPSGRRRNIGIDMDRAPYLFVEHLRKSLGNATLVNCEQWLRNLRAVKTAQEIDLLEEVAYRTDHGILSAAHHVLTTAWRPEKGLSEIIRVHCLERGLDAVGYHSVAQGVSGKNAQKFWPMAPRFGVGGGKALVRGEMVRLEIRATLNGYWSDASRILVMGQPSAKQIRVYDHLVLLRKTAINHLRLGVTCSSVFEAVRKVAKRKGIDLILELGVGHGIGVTPHEAPYLSAEDHTVVQEGMVVVLDPVIYGPNREILRSKDAVIVGKEGCRVTGWYKDWREPYIALDSYQHGGG